MYTLHFEIINILPPSIVIIIKNIAQDTTQDFIKKGIQ